MGPGGPAARRRDTGTGGHRGDRRIYARPRAGDTSAIPDDHWAAEIRAAVGVADLRSEILAVLPFTDVAAVATRCAPATCSSSATPRTAPHRSAASA